MLGPWLLGMIAATPVAIEQRALAPSGKWVLEYAEEMCLLQRPFGTGKRQVTFGIRPYPVGPDYEVLLTGPDPDSQLKKRGEARLRLSQAAAPVAADYVSIRLAPGKRLTTFVLEQPALSELAAAATIAITAGNWSETLAPTAMPAAIRALGECQRKLRLRWGIDPAALAATGRPAEPKGDPSDWITNADYPDRAIREGVDGTNWIVWTIGTDGRASDCKVVKSSGEASLDRAACFAIERHARYDPALDKSGKPMVSWGSQEVRWLIP